jgi:endonuclease-3
VRVNLVTKELFKRYKSAKDFAGANPKTLEQEVRSTGFFRNKAKSIREAAKMIVEKFGGEVPSTMEELLELPGVARKTANVVLGTWFKKATGVVVDTHVHRISRRLQLTREDDPKKIEQDLMALLPAEEWINFSHRVIWHGRKLCTARKPKCDDCPLSSDCPSAGKIA